MLQRNATVAVYDTHREAGSAINELRISRCDIRKLSAVCKDDRASGSVVGYYRAGGRIRYWGKSAAFWSGLWGLLEGWAFFVIPEIGPVLVAGPLAGWIITALENAAIFDGLSAVGAALYSIGISREQVARYEAAIRAGKCLVIAHGSSHEVDRVRRILGSSDTPEFAAQKRGGV